MTHISRLEADQAADSATADAGPVAAVVDMRAYAANTPPASDWLRGRAAPAFADEAAQVAAFALRGEGQVSALPTDEFILVLAGRLEVESLHGSLVLGPDDAGVIPVGTGFRWRSSDDMLAIVYAAPTAGKGNSDAPLLTAPGLADSLDKTVALGYEKIASCRPGTDEFCIVRAVPAYPGSVIRTIVCRCAAAAGVSGWKNFCGLYTQKKSGRYYVRLRPDEGHRDGPEEICGG